MQPNERNTPEFNPDNPTAQDASVTTQPEPTTTSPLETTTSQQHDPAGVHTQTPKKSHKRLIIGAILAVAILIAAGIGLYAWMQQINNPEARLYRALENHMRTPYIQKDTTEVATIANTSTTTINSLTDFTNVKLPKSNIKYERSTDERNAVTNAGEIAILDDKAFFSKVTKSLTFTFNGGSLDQEFDQWYQINDDAFLARLVFDPMLLRDSINTSTGEFLVGNFDDNTRTALIDFIKTQHVYTIAKSEVVTLDGTATTKYDLTIDNKLVNDLNQKAVKDLGLPTTTKKTIVDEDKGQMYAIWVSHDTDRIVKTEFTHDSRGTKDDGTKAKDVTTIKMKYPTTAESLSKPADVIMWQ